MRTKKIGLASLAAYPVVTLLTIGKNKMFVQERIFITDGKEKRWYIGMIDVEVKP